jgi:hypothetical protein
MKRQVTICEVKVCLLIETDTDWDLIEQELCDRSDELVAEISESGQQINGEYIVLEYPDPDTARDYTWQDAEQVSRIVYDFKEEDHE